MLTIIIPIQHNGVEAKVSTQHGSFGLTIPDVKHNPKKIKLEVPMDELLNPVDYIMHYIPYGSEKFWTAFLSIVRY